MGHKKRRLFDAVRQNAARRVRPKRRDARIVGVQYGRGSPPIQPFDQLAFRQSNFVNRNEKFQMRGRDARHHTNVGPSNRRKPRKLAAARHSHLEHGRLMRFFQAKQREREPVLVI